MEAEKRNFTKWTICGGSIISPRLVASSAHCFNTDDNKMLKHQNKCLRRKDGRPVGRIMVDVGINDPVVQKKSDLFEIEEVFYPDINKNEFNGFNDINANDFGLALLKKSLKIDEESSSLRTICLPEVNEEFSGKIATSIGWGIFEAHGNEVIEIFT